MSDEVLFQFHLFAMALFWGIGLCFSYDILRILRRLVRHSKNVVNVEDIIYWLAASAVVYALLFIYNQGEMRIFIVFGAIIGGLFYTLTISKVFIHGVTFLLSPFFKFFRNLRRKLRKWTASLKKSEKVHDE